MRTNCARCFACPRPGVICAGRDAIYAEPGFYVEVDVKTGDASGHQCPEGRCCPVTLGVESGCPVGSSTPPSTRTSTCQYKRVLEYLSRYGIR